MNNLKNIYIKFIILLTKIIRSLVAYLSIFIISLICLIPFIITLILPAKYRYNNKLFFWFADFFYRSVIYCLFLPVKIIGADNLPKDPVEKPAIFIANHQSSLDIPILGALCYKYPHIWLILEYYAYHPIIGIMVRRMNITVDRDNSAKAARSLISIIKFLEKYRSHLLIFPEGKRYIDGDVHKFFEGFAIIAKKTKRAVIPVFMPNNYKIFPPNSILINYCEIVVMIGQKFEFDETIDTIDSFTEKIKNWYINQVGLSKL